MEPHFFVAYCPSLVVQIAVVGVVVGGCIFLRLLALHQVVVGAGDWRLSV